jgi:hypothetical protein
VSGKIVHDLSSGGKVDDGLLITEGLYDVGTGVLITGVYYAGNNEIEIGPGNLTGTVTFVSDNHIKLSGSNNIFTAYVDDLLMFSNKGAVNACQDWVIDLSGSSGSVEPNVVHDPEPWGPVESYTVSDSVYTGLIYAPQRLVVTGGSKHTIIGAIVSQGIRLNGSNELIVYEDDFFSSASGSPPIIELIE